jgi:hypothetical protein
MYLIVYTHHVTQCREINLNANFLGWVYDTKVQVFHYQGGRFEQLIVKTEARDDNQYHSKFSRWTHEWRQVPHENMP